MVSITVVVTLLICLGLQAIVYKQYLEGKIQPPLGLALTFLLAFVNVLLATSLVVPPHTNYVVLQLFAATIIALGSAVGLHVARRIMSAGKE